MIVLNPTSQKLIDELDAAARESGSKQVYGRHIASSTLVVATLKKEALEAHVLELQQALTRLERHVSFALDSGSMTPGLQEAAHSAQKLMLKFGIVWTTHK